MAAVTDAIIGRRLEKVRNDLGFTLGDVATKVGFNHYQILSKIEKGERPARVSELARLAQIYYKDLGYFLSELDPPESEWSYAWRKNPGITSSKGLEARVLQLLMDYKLLEELTGEASTTSIEPWPKSESPMDFTFVSQKAEELSQQLGLGSRPAPSLPSIIEDKLGIKLLYFNMDEGISAVSAIGDFGYAIVVSPCEAPWRRSFNLAHELFHLYASHITPLSEVHMSADSGKSQIERFADAFASALLLPQGPLREALQAHAKDNRLELIDVISVASEFNVSTQALLYRMYGLKLLQSPPIKEIVNNPQFLEQNREARRPGNQPAQEFSPRMILLALKAMRKGKISMGRVCKMFGVRRTEFSSFLSERNLSIEIEQADDTPEVVLSCNS